MVVRHARYRCRRNARDCGRIKIGPRLEGMALPRKRWRRDGRKGLPCVQCRLFATITNVAFHRISAVEVRRATTGALQYFQHFKTGLFPSVIVHFSKLSIDEGPVPTNNKIQPSSFVSPKCRRRAGSVKNVPRGRSSTFPSSNVSPKP